MKKITFFLEIVLVLFVLIISLIFSYFNVYGKKIFSQQISRQFGYSPQVDSLTFSLPFVFKVRGFKLKDVSFDQLTASFGGYDFATKTLVFKQVSISGLKMKINQYANEIVVAPVYSKKYLPAERVAQSIDSQADKSEHAALTQRPLKIKKIIITQSQLDYTDFTKEKAIALKVKNINGWLNDFNYPSLAEFTFILNADLESFAKLMPNCVNLQGRVNLLQHNTQLALRLAAVKLSAFPYMMKKGWQLEDISVNEADLNIIADLAQLNDDLLISGKIEVTRVDYADSLVDNPKGKTLRTILAYQTKTNKNPEFAFNYRTKITQPQFGPETFQQAFGDFSGQLKVTFLQEVFQNLLGQNKAVVETVPEDNSIVN